MGLVSFESFRMDDPFRDGTDYFFFFEPEDPPRLPPDWDPPLLPVFLDPVRRAPPDGPRSAS